MLRSKNRKVSNWASKLSEYDIEVDYEPGEDNIVADFLSRHIHHEFFLKDSMFCYGLVNEARCARHPLPVP